MLTNVHMLIVSQILVIGPFEIHYANTNLALVNDHFRTNMVSYAERTYALCKLKAVVSILKK